MAEIFIGEHNWKEYAADNGYIDVNGERRYLSARSGKANPGFVGLPQNFKLIPKNEVKSRARDLIQAKATIKNVARRGNNGRGIPSLDQNGTNFCWVNSGVGAVQLVREMQGEQYVELSPASVANPINGGVNQGGYIEDALDQLCKVGACTADLYPVNFVGLKYWTPEAKANAAKHKITKWVSLGRRDETMAAKCWTVILQGGLVVNAHDWMGHSMITTMIDEDMNWWDRNSWGDDWGEHGFGKLEFSRGTPDAAWVPEWCLASLT